MKRTEFRRRMAVAVLAASFSAAGAWPQSTNHPPPNAGQQEGPRDPSVAPPDFNWHAPLPSAAQLKQRVLDNLKKSQAEQERYVCKTTQVTQQTDKNGAVKKQESKQYDLFFVNGQEIHEVTSKNGKPLSPEQQRKETERVQKEIQKDSDTKYVEKKDADNARLVNMLLHMLHYTNGHRVDLHGRPTLVYDLSGDPNVHPRGVQETFLHDMSGTIQVDELSGQLVDLNAHLDHDVKIGGGLLANLHKGFWIHVRQQRYPDGVWLFQKVEGNGDLRAALFFHPYFKFSQTMNDCALTTVTTSQGATTLAK